MKQRKPLRRVPLRSRREGPTADKLEHARAREERIANQRPPVTVARAVMGGSTKGPAPKAEKAKPGKRAPTVEERSWMDWITSRGCIACVMDGLGFRQPAVHHILRGGRRMGHLFTLPLCDPGHHQNGAQHGMVSRHPWKARFEARYGMELDLLERLRAEYARRGTS